MISCPFHHIMLKIWKSLDASAGYMEIFMLSLMNLFLFSFSQHAMRVKVSTLMFFILLGSCDLKFDGS